MSGADIIQWAVRCCTENGQPPTDSAILQKLRECRDVYSDVDRGELPKERK